MSIIKDEDIKSFINVTFEGLGGGIIACLAMLVIAAACIFIGVFLPALIFQLLWNYVAVSLGAPAIGYWLAFCGLWLVAIVRRSLFGA